MTGNKILLDTNIVIQLFKGNAGILTTLEQHEAIFISYVTLAELLLGAFRSSNTEKKLQEIKSFLQGCIVLNADALTAENYALIKSFLISKGKPIPENDIWIAAIAKQYNLPIYSDDKHFLEVEGISLISIS